MKKLLFILLTLSFSYSYADSDTCYVNARNYVNTYITQNSVRAITGNILNTALNKIINSIYCLDTSVANGTVTNVSVTTANGVSGSVATATTTPAITLTLGNITPTSVSAIGSVTGSNLSGTNTGDQDLSSYATSAAVATNYATKINLKDTSDLLRTLISAKGTGTVTSVSAGTGMNFTTITGTGAVNADTSVLSTKGNVTGLLLGKQNTLSLGTGVSSYLAQTRIFQTLTDGATITYNIASGYNAKVTLGGNRTLSITNVAAGDYGTLIVIQDGSGSKTLTLPAGSKVISGGAGAITLTTTANAIDVLSWFYDGTTYYWTYGKNYN